MKEVGQVEDRAGGNPTKRIRIKFSAVKTIRELEQLLGLRRVTLDFRSRERLPAEELHKVTAEHIWHAVQFLCENPMKHDFGPSTDFDLIAPNGDRLPLKAVFGLAATQALGFTVQPRHFSGGLGTVCFLALERAGYNVVPKGTDAPRFTELRELR
jgi:hypothetical protein